MNQSAASDLVRETLMTAMVVGAPILLIGMAAGLIIGFVQALTQIQDQTVSFVPKILAMGVATIICLPWLIQRLVEYTQQLYQGAAFIGS